MALVDFAGYGKYSVVEEAELVVAPADAVKGAEHLEEPTSSSQQRQNFQIDDDLLLVVELLLVADSIGQNLQSRRFDYYCWGSVEAEDAVEEGRLKIFLADDSAEC